MGKTETSREEWIIPEHFFPTANHFYMTIKGAWRSWMPPTTEAKKPTELMLDVKSLQWTRHWCLTPVIPAFGRLRGKDSEFESSLSYSSMFLSTKEEILQWEGLLENHVTFLSANFSWPLKWNAEYKLYRELSLSWVHLLRSQFINMDRIILRKLHQLYKKKDRHSWPKERLETWGWCGGS
jgi:hypothetical protein